MIQLVIKSLNARRLTVSLTLLAIAVSVALLLGVQRIQAETKQSFLRTVSGIDMIVGSRTGPLNLLLYSVFRIGQPANVMSWSSYQQLSQHEAVAWSVPFSLGDSHKGYRVLGTDVNYFRYYQYANNQKLQLAHGRLFEQPLDVVLGAQVAQRLHYQLGDEIVLAHGVGEISFAQHDRLPFQVVGILKPTGTPIDQTVHVPLEGLSAVHLGWSDGRLLKLSAEDALQYDLTPKEVTGFFVGLHTPILAFVYQRDVQTFTDEALSAILPGIALQELWSLMRVAQVALTWISGCVVFAGLLGMLTTQLVALNERRRELTILRTVGASAWRLFTLLLMEAVIITSVGIVLGVVLLYLLLGITTPYIQSNYGITLAIESLSVLEWQWLGWISLTGVLVGILPAARAYFYSLIDGMTLRV